MSRWWRAYDDALNDPKIQRLPPHLFKFWFNILCIASKYGGDKGTLPPVEEIAYLLRRRVGGVTKDVTALRLRRLLDGNELLTPHNWGARQFKSDISTQRVRDHRKRSKPVSGNGKETPPEQNQNRAETEKSLKGADAPVLSPSKVLFDQGRKYLEQNGCTEKNARSLIGQWKKKYGEALVIEAISKAQREEVSEPVGFIVKLLGASNGNGTNYPAGNRRGSGASVFAAMANAKLNGGVRTEPRNAQTDFLELRGTEVVEPKNI